MEHSLTSSKITRSILVIEEEYDLRVQLLDQLSSDHWNVLFALTEDTIQEAIQSVAGVILNWDLPELIDRDSVLKIIGNVPKIVTSSSESCNYQGFIKKPYEVADIVKATKIQIGANRFFVGDQVISRITPDWGNGKVVSIYPDDFYGVVFKSDEHRNATEIALRCHQSGLRWVKA